MSRCMVIEKACIEINCTVFILYLVLFESLRRGGCSGPVARMGKQVLHIRGEGIRKT